MQGLTRPEFASFYHVADNKYYCTRLSVRQPAPALRGILL